MAQRVVRDPPDSEFRSATYVAGPRFNLELLAEGGFGRASRPAVADLLRSTSLTSAMIRALERAQGPALAREQTFEVQRFSEAVRHAQDLGEALRNFAGLVAPVTEAVRSLPQVPQVLPSGGRLISLLSDPVMAGLYEMGVPRTDLDVPVMERVSEDPRALFSRGLNETADAIREYAGLLAAPSQAFAGS